MERANRWSQLATDQEAARIAEQDDAGAITRLLRNAPFSHIHADWHSPAEWLGEPTFVVVPASGSADGRGLLTRKLFGEPVALTACLAVAARPRPAAWVRLAAIADKDRGLSLLASMFSAILQPLRELETVQIAWLLVDAWPDPWLAELGFEQINEVITYVKYGTDSPQPSRSSDLEIRPAETADLETLAAIESRAFEPIWRHSERGLALAKQGALSFDVAWEKDKAVGFQFSSSTPRGAHLSRITVDPSAQNSGVGTTLLSHALDGFKRRGISTITLNTQLNNVASQNLYERFGFVSSGERYPVWNVQLSQ